MSKREELILKYPELFGEPPFDPQETLMCFGFECGDGWLPSIETFLEKVSVIVKEQKLEDFRIVQIKEKFGTLRIYVNEGTPEIYELIKETENKSGKTCEICGEEASLSREGGWFTTICPKCKEKGY